MPRNSFVTCCKENAVLVAVYEEKPKKRKLKTRNHHHHHHHHRLDVQQSSSSEGNNRRAELLSYSRRLRGSSKSTSPHRPKPLLTSSSKDQQTMAMIPPVQRKRKSKMQPGCLHLDTMFKCFATSRAKRRVKNKKKQGNRSATKKANAIMKTFNERTQKGARGFFKKLMAIIQRYR